MTHDRVSRRAEARCSPAAAVAGRQIKNLAGITAVGRSASSVVLSADGSTVMVGGSNDNGGVGAA